MTWGTAAVSEALLERLRRRAETAPVTEPPPAPPLTRSEKLRRMKVPKRYRHDFLEPAPAPATKAGDPWHAWTGDPWSLLLRGLTGTGKSMLAVEVLYRRGVGQWVCAAEIPALRYNDAEAGTWNHLCRTPLLVIDELGRDHQGGGWEAVGQLVSARYNEERATVVTTNLTARELMAEPRAGSLTDRLMAGWVITMDGPSRRGACQ